MPTLIIVWLVALALPAAATDFSKPGPFAVGLKTLDAPDSTGGKAPLPVTAWYPATGPSPKSDPNGIEAEANALPAATGPFPLVLLIHGMETTGMDYGMWGTQLASYGFVVLAADHDQPLPTPAERRLLGFDQVAAHLLYTRPSDVLREIDFADALTAPGGNLAGLIDTSRVGVWGHSTGGTTALQAAGAQIDFKELDTWCAANPTEKRGDSCQFVGHEDAVAKLYGAADAFAAPLSPISDNRVLALVVAAPGGELHVFGDTGIAVVKVPTLAMVSATDEDVNPKFNALWAYDGIASRDKALAVFDDGGHRLFVQISDPQFAPAQALTTAFFLDILKHDANAKAALAPGAVYFPGLTYKTSIH